MMTICPFETFDGAYVLDALSTADCQTFEAHLEMCDACIHRVSALQGVANLLTIAPLDAFSAASSAAPGPPPSPSPSTPPVGQLPIEPVPPDLLPNLLARLHRQRHRRRIVSRTVAALVAACVLALAGVVAIGRADRHLSVPLADGRSSATVTNAFLKASVSVTTPNSWDEVNLTCTYKFHQAIAGNYVAVAKDATGRTEVVASWPAIQNQTAVVHTPTTFRSGTITSVSILNARGQTLVQFTV